MVDQRRVAGLVADEKGAPVEGVSIVCENLTDGSIFTSTTDEKGNYVVNVGEGTCGVSLLGERKMPYTGLQLVPAEENLILHYNKL